MGGRTRPKAAPKRKQKPGGTIGEQVFAAVEKLTAGGAMTRSAAFKRVAKERKSTPGTVSVNYYRVANQKGVKLRRRRRRRGAQGKPTGSGGRISALLQELGRVLEEQQRMIGQLRKEREQFGRLRAVLGRL